MIGRRAAGLLFGLPLVFFLSVETATAQDGGSTVVKSPSAPPKAAPPQGLTEPEDELRPSLGDETSATGATPPSDELTPTAVDEGAGWEAAVEAAQAATPLIGVEQTKAVQRINSYFNNITNLQGSFEQVELDRQAHHRSLLCAKARQDPIRLRAAERLAHHRRRKVPGDRGL